MALIKCPECGKQMSDMASSCPHCGYTKNINHNSSKKSKPKNSKSKFSIKYLVIIVVLFRVFHLRHLVDIKMVGMFQSLVLKLLKTYVKRFQSWQRIRE